MGISAVMTCYNRDTVLVEKAITSVLTTAQESDFRLILLDNHSPNVDVRKLLKTYRDPRVQVLDFGKNVGKGRGFNLVWQAKKILPEDYVTVISDDIEVLTPGWDQRFVTVFQKNKHVGSLSAFIQSGPGMPDPQLLQKQTIGEEELLISHGSIGGDLTMYRPGILKEAGLFTPTLYGHEDHDMALKLGKMGYISAYVKGVKMNHYGHEDSLYAEWKKDYHDGKTGLQFTGWLEMREGNLKQKLRDLAATRFHIPIEGQRGSRR